MTARRPRRRPPNAAGGDPPAFFDSETLWRSLSRWGRDILVAGPFLTRLPWPRPKGRITKSALAKAMRAFPLIGLAVAIPGGLLLWLLSAFEVGPLAAALAALALIVLLTGGLHEDGLADSADGLFGGDEPSKRLDLMHRGDTGPYGALALIFSVGLRAALLAGFGDLNLAAAALLAAAAASRAAPVALAYRLDPARSDGLAAALGKPPLESYYAALALAAALALLFLGPLAGLLAILLTGGVVYGLERLAERRIGGVTGDIMGAGQQLAEIAILFAAALAL